ncbi:hypothetical protein S83_003486 [Arachis hypogaea]
MSSSSLGAHPPSDSSCCSWSSCRRRLGVIISKVSGFGVPVLQFSFYSLNCCSEINNLLNDYYRVLCFAEIFERLFDL